MKDLKDPKTDLVGPRERAVAVVYGLDCLILP
jgi:hypothetical protein